nr:unnamed protein product [Callosobruchus chinensis]
MPSRGKNLVELALALSNSRKSKRNNNIMYSYLFSISFLGNDILGQKRDANVVENAVASTSGYTGSKSDDKSNIDEAPYIDSSESFSPTNSELSFEDEDDYDQTNEKEKGTGRAHEDLEAISVVNEGSVEENLAETNKKRVRRKKADKASWKRSVVKAKRLSGMKYVNRSGKEVPEKKPLVANCARCRYKCNLAIPNEQRGVLCQEFWSLGDYDKQKLHLSSLITTVPVKRRKVETGELKRKTSRIYYLKDTNGSRKRVCLNFFCKTFAISHRVVETCMKNISSSGMYIGYDKRKDTKPHNLTDEGTALLVHEHIDSFPRVESHYCRKDSTKQYLGSDLNISIMHRLYCEDFCASKNIQPVSRFIYQKIFHQYEPALDFFIPKKDQCYKCNAYKSATDKTLLLEEYESHKKREKDAMLMKKKDKEKLLLRKEAILQVHFAGDNQIFYKLKLNVYNFTIFDASNSNGYCYVWDETHGKKGSTEIGTCILKYLYELPETVTHVSSFSDTCGGQNRNKYVAAAMLFAVNKIHHLNVIDLKFMESGHSYLEADAMHATIERARKHKSIYTTREWSVLISTARRNPRPYYVNNLRFDDFYDLQELAATMTPNTTTNTNQEKVQWLKIKWMRFEKTDPYLIKYKYELSDEEFLLIDVAGRRKRGRQQGWSSYELSKKYSQRIPISLKKKNDLLFLLLTKVIPTEYQQYIQDIPATLQPAPQDDD